MKDVPEIRVVQAREDDQYVLFDFLRSNFFPDEPMNAALHRIPPEEEFTTLTSVKSGLSFVAYARGEDGQDRIAGLVLNKALSRKDQETRKKVEDMSAKQFQIHEMLRKLDEKADIWSRMAADEVFYIVILSVSKDHRRLNIGQKLMEESLKKAVSSGYKYATVECSSYYSAKMMDKLGFERICEIRYEDHRNDRGEVIFVTSKPHESIVKFLKKL